MNANTHTTMALPTRRDQRTNARRAPSRPGPYQAACRPENRTKPACEPAGACPRPACVEPPCHADRPETKPTAPVDPNRPNHDREPEADRSNHRTVATERWSPGPNRSRPPITNCPSNIADGHPTPANRHSSPRPSNEDEWSRGRMQAVAKPSWTGKFASRMRGESGMSTAEYAVGTLAAVAFAGVLLKVLTSGTVQSALTTLIERALA